LFTGISYTADKATVTAKMILAIIAAICALLFFVNAVLRRWMVPTIGLILLQLSAIVLGLVYPGAVQYFSVRPDEPDKERSYNKANIEATRAAYGADKVEITDYSAKTAATAGQLRADAEALPGIRLIDPNVVSPAYEQLQQVRGYYAFPKNLDVDRYTINGKETTRGRGTRNGPERCRGQLEQPQNCLHPRLRAGRAYGNKRQPAANRSGLPRTSANRIDRGARAAHLLRGIAGPAADQYSIVGDASRHTTDRAGHPWRRRGWQPEDLRLHGKGGVKIGSMWMRLLYAAKFADVNICSPIESTLNPRSFTTARRGSWCRAPRHG
jgi:uncharacterized membrane protein (UPF0182 family)